MLPIALTLAWLLDDLFGEPPNALHPVAWLGQVLGPIGRSLCTWPSRLAFGGGAAAWMTLASVLGLTACAVQQALGRLPVWLGGAVLALLIKPTFAWRMLRDEVQGVEAALGMSVAAGRERIARLASRDVSLMDEAEIRETAIETLAENLNDSVIAPLFWFAIAGLPGAVVYRFANTADAMWGYRGRFEWAGKWAAWADDVLSWAPARLTALLLRPAFHFADWQGLRIEARRTPSPNGGWPMGAIALRLGVRLRKPGVYALNAQARSPVAADTANAIRAARVAAWTAMSIVLSIEILRVAA